MSELRYFRKADLQMLAKELEVEIGESDTIKEIIRKIEAMDDYDKELAVSQVKFIEKDRENKLLEEKEKQRLTLEREEFERVSLEKDKEREFQLEKLRLTQEVEGRSTTSNTTSEKTNKLPLKAIMHRFDEKNSEISLFLNLFERQAKKCNLDSDELVTNLLALLPIEMAEMILREPESKIDDYSYVKTKLLERFKMNTEAYRQKFNKHPRNPNSPWKDLVFELNGYLEGWLTNLEITNLEQLKKLLVTDQIKRRASQEMREHFIDNWAEFKEPEELVKHLDAYEAIKGPPKKTWNSKPPFEKKTDEIKTFERACTEDNSSEKS